MKLPINVNNLDRRDKTILIGLFFSRFGRRALNELEFRTFSSAYNVLGRAIGVKPERIRDTKYKFDHFYHNEKTKEQKRKDELPNTLKKWENESKSWSYIAFLNVIKSIASSNSDTTLPLDKNDDNTLENPAQIEGISDILSASDITSKLESIFKQIDEEWQKQEHSVHQIVEDDNFDDDQYDDENIDYLNIEGNIGDFIKAEKYYKEKYQNFLSSLHTPELPYVFQSDSPEKKTENIERWLNQEFSHKNELFLEFIDGAEEVLEVTDRIIVSPYPYPYLHYALHELKFESKHHTVASCICFHSFMTNLCEFIHLHRKPKKFKTGWFLAKKAAKYLGINAKHYIRYACNICKLFSSNLITRLTKEFLKLLYRNLLYTPNTDSQPRDVFEACMPLANLAYYPHHINSPVTLSNGYTFDGIIDLPFGLKGYIGKWNKIKLTIIGFRGTKITNIWNDITDLSQYLAGLSYVYLMALGLLLDLQEQSSDSRFLVTGHSLGGGLTQFAVAGLNSNNAIGFGYNSAGLSDLANDILKGRFADNIFHLHLRNDQIFHIGHQLGSHYDQDKIENNCVKAHELDTMMDNSSSQFLSYNEVCKILI